MAKNMTRKSLAIASAASMAVLGLAAPAGAAGLADKSFVSLAPTSGTSYKVLALDGQTFSLTANESASIDGLEDLKFLVADADAEVFPVGSSSTGVTYAALAGSAFIEDWTRTDGTVTLTFDDTDHGLEEGEIIQVTTAIEEDTADAATTVVTGYYTLTDVTGATAQFVDGLGAVAAGDATTNGTENANFNGVIKASGIVRDADDNSFVVDTGVQTAGTDEVLVLAVESSDAVSVAVTAWVDNNDDSDIDSTEYTSETRTVEFLAADALTPSITWSLQVGVNPSAVVTFAEDLNASQTASGDFVAAMVNGTDSQTVSETWDSTDEDLTLAGNANVTVEGNLTLTLDNADGDEIAAWTYAVVDNDVEYFSATVVENENVAAGATPANGANFTGTVRSDSSATVVITAYNSDDEVVEGVVITLDNSGSDENLSGADTFTVNGEEVDAAGAFDATYVTTNADGEASFVVAAVDETTDGDDLSISFTAEGVSKGLDDDGEVATDNANNVIKLTWADADYSATVLNIVDAKGTTTANATGTGLFADSFTADVHVADQWNQIPDNGTYRVEATVTQDGNSDNVFVPVVGGRASVGINGDADAAAGTEISAVLDLQVYSSATATYADEDTNFQTIYLAPDQGAVAGRVTFGSAPAAKAISTTALVEANTKMGDTAPTVGTVATITGTVKDNSDGTVVKGSMVTVSGSSNLLFVADGVYSFGSISGYAGDAGDFSFAVYSNISGEYTVTASSLGGTDTVDIEFSAATAISGADLSIDVANATPGQTMIITGTLVDKFGNAVDSNQGSTAGINLSAISVDYDGPGLIVGDLPTETDADGEFVIRVLLGTNDIVTGTVTATYGGANGVVGTGDDDITATASLSTAAESSAVATWTKNLNDGTVKMYAKNIVGAGKVQFMVNGAEVAWVRAADATDPKLRSANGSYYLVRTVDLVEGQKNVLEIYVDGVRTTRTAYTY